MPPLPTSIEQLRHPQRPVHPGPEPIHPRPPPRPEDWECMQPPFFPPWWFWPPPGVPPGGWPPCPPGPDHHDRDRDRDVAFGSNPPSHPHQGKFWWDGTEMKMWDGTQWQLIGPTDPSNYTWSGVTDGSNAAQGEVGEFIQGNSPISFQAYPQITQAVVTPLIVQPGDWDFTGSLAFNNNFDLAYCWLSPVPSGMSNNMGGYLGNLDPAISFGTNTISMQLGSARGSFSMPTVLPFLVTVNNSDEPTATAGTASLRIEGRRRR